MAVGLEDLTRALEMGPKHSRVHMILGAHYVRRGQLDKVLAIGNEMVQRYPTCPHGHIFRSVYWRQQGDLERAQQASGQAVAISRAPAFLKTHAANLMLAKRFDEAIAIQLEVLRKVPSKANNHLDLALLY